MEFQYRIKDITYSVNIQITKSSGLGDVFPNLNAAEQKRVDSLLKQAISILDFKSRTYPPK